MLSNIEFNIPKHTLDIIYSQTICWMGLFFSPLISLITFVKLLVIFYLRLGYLNFLCKPSSSLYEASKISSYMKIFLLISFASALFPLTYIISQMEPSETCGPFRGVVISPPHHQNYTTTTTPPHKSSSLGPIVVTTGIIPISNIGNALVSAMYGRSSEPPHIRLILE